MHLKISGMLCFRILVYWQSSQGGRTKTTLCSAVLSFGYQLLTFLDCRKVFILQVTVPAEDYCPELPVPALLPDVTQRASCGFSSVHYSACQLEKFMLVFSVVYATLFFIMQ